MPPMRRSAFQPSGVSGGGMPPLKVATRSPSPFHAQREAQPQLAAATKHVAADRGDLDDAGEGADAASAPPPTPPPSPPMESSKSLMAPPLSGGVDPGALTEALLAAAAQDEDKAPPVINVSSSEDVQTSTPPPKDGEQLPEEAGQMEAIEAAVAAVIPEGESGLDLPPEGMPSPSLRGAASGASSRPDAGPAHPAHHDAEPEGALDAVAEAAAAVHVVGRGRALE